MSSRIQQRVGRFRVGEVDACEPDTLETLKDLHAQIFLDRAPLPDFEAGHWWITSELGQPIAFAGLIPSALGSGIGYLSRVGVFCGSAVGTDFSGA